MSHDAGQLQRDRPRAVRPIGHCAGRRAAVSQAHEADRPRSGMVARSQMPYRPAESWHEAASRTRIQIRRGCAHSRMANAWDLGVDRFVDRVAG